MQRSEKSRFGAAFVALLTLFGVILVSSAEATPAHWTNTNNPDRAFIPAHASSSPALVNNQGTQSGVSCTAANVCMSVGSDFNNINSPFQSRTFWWDDSARWIDAPDSNIASAQLNAVSCLGVSPTLEPGFCMAVGSAPYLPGGGHIFAHTQSEVFNGSTFSTPASTDGPGTSNSLNGVSCVSSTNCTAVGGTTYSNGGPYFTLIEHWNGSAWTIVPSPSPSVGSQNALTAVSCKTTFCVATGSAYAGPDAPPAGFLETSYNGGPWQVRATGLANLSGVSCTDGSFCKVTGAKVYTWHGTGLTLDSTPANPPGYILGYPAVSCVSRSFCIAAQQFAGPTPAAAHSTEFAWNGTAWATAPGAFTEPGGLVAVSCATTTFCFATGTGGIAAPGPTAVKGQ
jgi:hypothetical protein